VRGIDVNSKRIVLAALLSPWTAPATLIIAATMVARRWPFNFSLWQTAGLGVLPAYGGLVLVGLPLFFWLRRTQRLDLVTLTVCGALGAVLFLLAFTTVLSFVMESALGSRELILDVWYGLLLGSAVAIAFGAIAGVPGRRRAATV
jgi:hypothetical protein